MLTALFTVGMIVLIIEVATHLSHLVSEGALAGLLLAVKRVIPTSLPFMILSDLFIAYAAPEDIPLLPQVFKWIFSLPKRLFGALVVGWVSGFPIGARIAADMYRRGEIEKGDAERLAAFSSMPSPAFVIGVAGGILGGKGVGILLLISLYIGTVLAAQLFRVKCATLQKTDINIRQSFSFVESVKRAGIASVGIAAFISVFSILSILVRFFIPSDVVRLPIITLLEVAGAIEFLGENYAASPYIAVGLSALSLGFGGVSVACQSSAFLKAEGLSVKPYILIRLCAGIFSALAATILYILCGGWLGF